MGMTLLIVRIANTDRLQSCLSLSSMFVATLIGLMLLPWMSGNGLVIHRISYFITVLGEYHDISFSVWSRALV